MLKVADFGTSRFLEIAAHGTTVIGSPPYMAPEQFHGKAVFASDIYSLGVTMYQMLTGTLPYDTPAPADLGKLMSGELVSNPRLLNPAIPESDQRHHPEGDGARRHRRATSARRDLLEDVLARTDADAVRRRTPPASTPPPRGAPAHGCRGRMPPASRAACASARRRRPASAGSAASRCTPAPIAVRSAARPSDQPRRHARLPARILTGPGLFASTCSATLRRSECLPGSWRRPVRSRAVRSVTASWRPSTASSCPPVVSCSPSA